MQAKDKVLEALVKNTGDTNRNRLTAADLAGLLNLSRQVVSHYLTRLMEEGLVAKTPTRPVYWYPVAQEDLDFLAGAGDIPAVYTVETTAKKLMVAGDTTTGGAATGTAATDVAAIGFATTGTATMGTATTGAIATGSVAACAAAGVATGEAADKAASVFSALVGHDGSQRQIVELCKAAVNYPPNGLPMLITGSSGVGKSFIARLIYEYAVARGVLAADAPFVVLNCADYANNPELLSATLLGYKKGSFTGADRDKDGLLTEADGGYLFLDEVHRLNFENQEKLFLFMDAGKFRPLGEPRWKQSRVRLIFATTEQPEQVLLETFRRRITLQLPIIGMTERPVRERMQLLRLFFWREARKLQREIYVHNEVISQLCFTPFAGNIGKLQHLVQLSCANAYYQQKESTMIVITRKELPAIEWTRGLPLLAGMEYMIVDWKETQAAIRLAAADPAADHFSALWQMIAERIGDPAAAADHVFVNFKTMLKKAREDKTAGRGRSDSPLLGGICEEVLPRYGIAGHSRLTDELGFLYEQFSNYDLTASESTGVRRFLESAMPKAGYIADCLCDRLARFEGAVSQPVRYLFTLTLHEYVNEAMEFYGLIVAHGDSTASSIQKVANLTCRTFVFEAIDMPMDTTIDDTIAKVQQYLSKINTRRGLILLIDTGSLNQMYSSINNLLSGDLLIINNVSTAIALDIGIKMLGRVSFLDIVRGARESYVFDIQYFEGIARGRNIIVSCMSGVGIAEKLQETMQRVIDPKVVDIVTIEYQELTQLLEQREKEYFKQTLLILTTTSLPDSVTVPWVNIYDILEGSGEKQLWNALRGLVPRTTFEALKLEYVRFFSIEGIVSRLRFLNPAVIVNEVEMILMKYEQYYDMEINVHVRLNLYMHIAFMIERLMTAVPEIRAEKPVLTADQAEFFRICGLVFQDVEAKYRIQVDNYEKGLLYELFRRIIRSKIN